MVVTGYCYVSGTRQKGIKAKSKGAPTSQVLFVYFSRTNLRSANRSIVKHHTTPSSKSTTSGRTGNAKRAHPCDRTIQTLSLFATEQTRNDHYVRHQLGTRLVFSLKPVWYRNSSTSSLSLSRYI